MHRPYSAVRGNGHFLDGRFARHTASTRMVLAMTGRPAGPWQVSARRLTPARRGAWIIPLLGRSALQLIEDQFAMLLECAEALFERIEH